MQIVVYGDETVRPKSSQSSAKYVGSIGMAGYIATADYWKDFCKEWRVVLNAYDVRYFHFREINRAGRSRKQSPFYGWTDDKADDFIYSLAKIAGRVAVPVGSNVFLAPLDHKNYRADTWKHAFDTFFGNVLEMMSLHWPTFKEPVRFFFDRQKNDEIVKQLNASIGEYQRKDSRIGNYAFDTKTENLPLQAADMISYSLGQSGERAFNQQRRQSCRILDVILFMNQYPKGHHLSLPWYINDAAVDSLIEDFRAHKKIFDAQRKEAGLPKTEYFPEIHFTKYDRYPTE